MVLAAVNNKISGFCALPCSSAARLYVNDMLMLWKWSRGWSITGLHDGANKAGSKAKTWAAATTCL
jgi:hypothetical protein